MSMARPELMIRVGGNCLRIVGERIGEASGFRLSSSLKYVLSGGSGPVRPPNARAQLRLSPPKPASAEAQKIPAAAGRGSFSFWNHASASAVSNLPAEQ